MDHTSWKILLIIILATEGKGSYLIFINESMTWLAAQTKCHSYKGYLINDEKEVNNTCTRQNFRRMPSYWLGIHTSLTPYIAHLGCYRIPLGLNINKSTRKEIQSIGGCYNHCSKSNYTRFGIMNKHCVCLMEPEVNQLTQSERSSCNITCNAFKEEKYCGGKGTYSVYYINGAIKDDGDGRCIYFDCTSTYGQYYQTDCANRLEGRICGNGINNSDQANFSEARRRCFPSYLKSSTDCFTYSVQARVRYWLDIRRYEFVKFDREDTMFSSNELPYLCFLRLQDRHQFADCNIESNAVCKTEGTESSEFPVCSAEKDMSNTVSGKTVPETTKRTSLHSEKTTSTECQFCATEYNTTHTSNGFTESKKMESSSNRNDGAHIWGPILGTIVVIIGCVVGSFMFYRTRRKACKDHGTDIKENTSSEDPRRNYFVLEAKAALPSSTAKNNPNYDNAYQQCDLPSSSAMVAENESVYAEQPEDVYDELNKRRPVNKMKNNQNENIYSENMVNTVAENGVYNTLDSTIQKVDVHVPYTIEDSEGYGHLKIDGLKKSTDSNYDHC